jgi:hypothetical protein
MAIPFAAMNASKRGSSGWRKPSTTRNVSGGATAGHASPGSTWHWSAGQSSKPALVSTRTA